jgi:hypothetical protein
MSRNQRLGIVLGAVIVAVVAFVLANSGGSSGGHFSGNAHIFVVNGQPKGGIAQLRYKHGQTIDLTVTSDVADEIHIHGYDLHKDVTKGGSVHFSFPASIEGTIVIELESRKEQIASLMVVP